MGGGGGGGGRRRGGRGEGEGEGRGGEGRGRGRGWGIYSRPLCSFTSILIVLGEHSVEAVMQCDIVVLEKTFKLHRLLHGCIMIHIA